MLAKLKEMFGSKKPAGSRARGAKVNLDRRFTIVSGDRAGEHVEGLPGR